MPDLNAYLHSMGIAWFISYSYYLRVDPGHTNWRNVGDADSRISTYESGNQYYRLMLDIVGGKDLNRLARNGLGLTVQELRDMFAALRAVTSSQTSPSSTTAMAGR